MRVRIVTALLCFGFVFCCWQLQVEASGKKTPSKSKPKPKPKKRKKVDSFEHGPSAKGFPSHTFQLKGRSYHPQLNVHFGLIQPILFRGFNIAVDFRIGRWVFEYSHGMGLRYDALPAAMQKPDAEAGMKLSSPWTTGFGIGFNVIDDLFIMVEFKAHRYNASLFGQDKAYTTISIGPTLGYRFFWWKGLNTTLYLRYWPNVWVSDKIVAFQRGRGTHKHNPTNLNLFLNLSIGWAFDLSRPRS